MATTGKRVLLLGATGIDKRDVLRRLQEHLKHELKPPHLECFDFEREFIRPQYNDFHNYLDADEVTQRRAWREAWQSFEARLLAAGVPPESDMILSLHGVLARPLYSVRSPVDIGSLRRFAPTHIITLIDNIYTKWARTEQRAQGKAWRGQPTLADLAHARRAEIFFGDVLAGNFATAGARLQNHVLAVQHAARTLARLIFRPRTSKMVYLSFPISGPRKRATTGDRSGIAQVNEFLKAAAERDKNDHDAIVFYPLTIDELPLDTALRRCAGAEVELQPADRWDVRDFLGDADLLSDPDAFWKPKPLAIRKELVESAMPLVGLDVATRDFRLVMQSARLAVFNPWFDGVQALGIDNEIDCATMHQIPVHIFQDPAHDPKDETRKKYQRPAGALGTKLTNQYVLVHDTLQSLLDEIYKE